MKSRYILLFFCIFVYLFLIFNAGFHGPDEPIYFAYTASVVEDGDLNVVNQLYSQAGTFYISKTFNFPDFHNHGSVILWAPFYICAKAISLVATTFRWNSLDIGSFDRVVRAMLSFSTFLMGLFTLLLTYVLSKTFFSRKISVYSIVAIFLGTQFFYYMLFDVGNANIPAALCSTLSILFFVYLVDQPSIYWFLYGVFFSFAVTIKTELWFQMIFIIPILWFLFLKKKIGYVQLICFSLGLIPLTILRVVNAYFKHGGLHLEEVIYLASSLRYKASYCFDGIFNPYRGILYTSPILCFCLLGFILAIIRIIRNEQGENKLFQNVLFAGLAVYAFIKIILIGRVYSPGGDSLSTRLLLTEFPVFVLLLGNFIQMQRRWFIALFSLVTFFIIWHILIVSELIAGLDWFYIVQEPSLASRSSVLRHLVSFFFIPQEIGLKLFICLPALFFLTGIYCFYRKKWLAHFYRQRMKQPLFYVKYLLYGVVVYATLAYTAVTFCNLWNNKRNVDRLKKAGFFDQAVVIGAEPFKMNALEEEEHLWTVFEMMRYYALKGSTDNFYFLKGLRKNIFSSKECVNTLFSKPIQPYFNIADKYKSSARYQEAIAFYEESLALAPDDIDTLLSAGDLYMLSGEYYKAITAFTRVIKINPTSVNASCRLAEAYNKIEDFNNAITYYQKCVQLNPNFTDAYIILGSIYQSQNDYPRAIGYFLKVLQLNPNSADACMLLGSIYHSQNDYPRAIGYFLKVLQLNPNSADAYSTLGSIYHSQNDYPRAIGYFLKVLQLNPNSADAYSTLGSIYQSQNDSPKAIECYQKYLRLRPNSADAYSTLGSIYQSQNEYLKAIECLLKVLQLNPNSADVYSNLGNIYNGRGDYDKAVSYLQQYLRFHPGSVDTYCALVDAYRNKGDRENALKQIKKIRELGKHVLAEELEKTLGMEN